MLAELTIQEFLARVSNNEPVPGGGSIAALHAATATSLGGMVAGLTIGKKKYVEVEEWMKEAQENLAQACEHFLHLIDLDADAYRMVFDAYKLPKATPEEQAERTVCIQEAIYVAATVPMQTATHAVMIMEVIAEIAHKGNVNAITDACVAMMTVRTAILSAALNVRINLSSLADKEVAKTLSNDVDRMEEAALVKEKELREWVNAQLAVM